ncbi:MAG: hypothetical protein ACRDK9_13250 [Solirubrobacterales bacterium]
MEVALLVAAVLVAGLACPAMMWWQRRRGREAACCAPAPRGRESGELEALRERQRELAARLAALDGDAEDRVPTRGETG